MGCRQIGFSFTLRSGRFRGRLSAFVLVLRSFFCTAGPTTFTATRFLSSGTVPNGQPSVVAVDIIALMDALKIEKATIAGFDWGARTPNIIAALWPQRCKAMVSVSGYLIGSPESGKMQLPPQSEPQCWYQSYFATERGRAGYEKYRLREAHLADRFAEVELR